MYKKLEEMISIAIKDRSDVLPSELLVDLIEKHSEIPIFNGSNIKEESFRETMVKELVRSADIFKKDLDFQVMVSSRRKDSRLKQIKVLEEDTTITSDQ